VRDWFCPACGGRLSYGVYCKVCEIETAFSFRPATEADIEARRALQAKADLDSARAIEEERRAGQQRERPGPPPPATPDLTVPGSYTVRMRVELGKALALRGFASPDAQHAEAARITGKPVGLLSELSHDDVRKILDWEPESQNA
jgi:hypothetical protein